MYKEKDILKKHLFALCTMRIFLYYRKSYYIFLQCPVIKKKNTTETIVEIKNVCVGTNVLILNYLNII